MPIMAKDYQRRLEDYNENVAANETELRKVKVYKNITPTVYQPPNVLSVFSEGLEKQIASSAKIEKWICPIHAEPLHILYVMYDYKRGIAGFVLPCVGLSP